MTTRILLTADQKKQLRRIAERLGTTQEELMRKAVVKFLSGWKEANWKKALLRAKGMWKNRKDLPDLRQLRAESNRDLG